MIIHQYIKFYKLKGPGHYNANISQKQLKLSKSVETINDKNNKSNKKIKNPKIDKYHEKLLSKPIVSHTTFGYSKKYNLVDNVKEARQLRLLNDNEYYIPNNYTISENAKEKYYRVDMSVNNVFQLYNRKMLNLKVL